MQQVLWDGFWLLSQEADISVAPISNAGNRRSVMDFVDIHFYPEYYSPMYKKPPYESKTSGLFLHPFKYNVWHYIISAVLLEAILFGLVSKTVGKIKSQKLHILDSLCLCLGTIFQRGKTRFSYSFDLCCMKTLQTCQSMHEDVTALSINA